MNIKIFDINEGKITINENCLLIPELKEIVDTYVVWPILSGHLPKSCSILQRGDFLQVEV